MLNSVTLVGRLTKDVDLRYTPNGVPVATFTLAVNRPFSSESGERQADFINCVVWRKPAENAANYLKKGSLAGVKGTWQTRHYEGQDGKRIFVNECHCENVQFLEPKQQNGQNPPPNNQGNTNTSNGNQNANTRQYESQNNYNPYGGGNIDISDDDLPF